jgi:magnesium transporter
VSRRPAAGLVDDALKASTAGVRSRLEHRLPWLAIGLFGAMLSAGIVASFEDALRENVLLAFFVPAVVYMADAVGTQTEAIVIRGIALGVPLRSIVRNEILSGAIVGCLLASVFLGFVLVVWHDLRVAAAVSIALALSATIATVIAMMLPYLFTARGLDPAFGSGPIATVIQDLLSLAVYFAVAALLLGP